MKSFLEECRADRASLANMVEKMERGQLGIGAPITLPAMNDATNNFVHHLKRSIAELDALIGQLEAECNA